MYVGVVFKTRDERAEEKGRMKEEERDRIGSTKEKQRKST